MNITNDNIDSGKAFDWGKTSADYVRFRDIYPQEFYDKIINRQLCISGQSVLDVGTGTGVLPRNMYRFGAKWTGTDISENQIRQAKILSEGMNIDYYTLPTEAINFPDESFDVITACQCFFYFDHEQVMPRFYRMLKQDGCILVLYMVMGIGVAIYLSYLHGTIYEDHQGLIACACFVGFCSAYFLIQNISKILKENHLKKSKE